MSYASALDRLQKLSEWPGGVPTKPTKAPFVSYGSTPVRHSEKNTPPETTQLPALEPVQNHAPLRVTCGQCQHFKPDSINPAQGWGSCRVGADGNWMNYPDTLRLCRSWKPTPAALLDICRRAVADYPTVPAERLRRFLEVAEDPEWCSERVARHIARRMAEGLVTWEPGQ